MRVDADDDLLPSDAPSIVVVVIDNGALAIEKRTAEDDLQPRRPQAARAGRVRKRVRDRRQARGPPVDCQLGVPGDPRGVGPRIDSPGLERRDLRHIEDVQDVEARA